jgi:CDP-glycerol glycerophosphotransferase (TagB/SpsB family)
MLTEKPMISFAYDYIHYRSDERGTFYELDDVFPGPVCSSFEKLLVSLKKFLKGDSLFSKESYTARRKIFHKFSDTKNSIRVIEMIKEYTSEK